MTSVDHNVITNATGILTASSGKLKKASPSLLRPQDPELELEIESEIELISYEALMLEEIDALEPYEQHMCAYIASCIEEHFFQDVKLHKYKCMKCVEVLSSADERINDELLAMKIDCNQQPTASTLKIVIFANAIMNIFSLKCHQGNDFKIILQAICKKLDVDDLYINFETAHHELGKSKQAHKKQFISHLVKTYLVMKSRQIGKKITDDERGALIRHRSKRAYILRGQ